MTVRAEAENSNEFKSSPKEEKQIRAARALIARPDVLVLDEPTSALEVPIRKQVLSRLQSLPTRYGLSYFLNFLNILITHDMDVIHAMAHAVIVMSLAFKLRSLTCKFNFLVVI